MAAVAALAGTALLATACTGGDGGTGPADRSPVAAQDARYVGGARCAACHPDEARSWRGSHHDLAMAPADDAAVLGAFDGRRVTEGPVAATFLREGETFVVRSEEVDGTTSDLRVTHAFGVDPLQQYLVPRPGGRLQALPWAWDARPASEGGERWFHLYADDPPPPGDALHWASRPQTWNAACASCHSTGLTPGYDAASDSYATTWVEIDVSCEACHGPGARHVAWAEDAVRGAGAPDGQTAFGLAVDLGHDAAWIQDAETGIARREPPGRPRAEIDTCARCHALRAPIAPDDLPGRPLLDAFTVELLDEGLYHADGQVDAEVYVYGSFLQSRMHAAGVTCSDCHDPHALTLPGPSPDAVCARCHAPSRFSARAHHGHEPAGPGGSCVACHMPATTFMGVDARRDHSFRVPRPDLTLAIGTPNACADCHAERGAAWAAAAIARLHGPGRAGHFGEALHAGRAWAEDARTRLLRVAESADAPGIVRGTALDLLGRYATAADEAVFERAAGDPDPLVRLGAAQGTRGLRGAARYRVATLFAGDAVRAVRIAAVSSLVPPATDGGPPQGDSRQDAAERARVDAAWREYRASFDVGADRAAAWIARGALEAAEVPGLDAERSYLEALELEPWSVAARVNLADYYRIRERDDDAIAILREALALEPESAAAHYALGLALVRADRDDQALAALSRAARLDPLNPDFAYAHGVALHSFGREKEGIAALDDAARRMPAARELRSGLFRLLLAARRFDEAAAEADALVALDPWFDWTKRSLERARAAAHGRP